MLAPLCLMISETLGLNPGTVDPFGGNVSQKY